jgi:hypothetical protein
MRRLLHRVDLQPHRTRYRRTARLDGRFKDRAGKVLWRYANDCRPAERGIPVACLDGMPIEQVLERRPIPGSIEQREFGYTRKGTINILTFLVVQTGRTGPAILESHHAEHLIPELEALRREHHRLRGVFLVPDGGGSQIASETTRYFAGCAGWWRPRLKPTHALRLNQGEILNPAFGLADFKRGSWTGRAEYVAHVMAS